MLQDGVEENVGTVFNPSWDGENIPVQENRELQGDVLVKISNKTVMGLILPEIIYNIKRKLGCNFIENHNSESLDLQRGQSIGVVTSCVVTQEELGQQPEKHKEDMQCVIGLSNCAETRIGGVSVGNGEKVEKAGRKAECLQTIENRQSYETETEKRKFIRESFQLDTTAILNTDAKLKKAVVKFFFIPF